MKTIKEKPFNYISQKFHPELSDEEKIKLFNHYQDRELNQFFLIIINKVLEKKTFTLDDHSVVLGLLVKYENYDFSEISMDCIDDIVQFAAFIYMRLMIIDIMEIDASGF